MDLFVVSLLVTLAMITAYEIGRFDGRSERGKV